MILKYITNKITNIINRKELSELEDRLIEAVKKKNPESRFIVVAPRSLEELRKLAKDGKI